MKEIQYQMKYINKLANTAKDLLHDAYRDSSTIVFKAPTGSGKTYMVSQTLTQMVKDNPEMAFAFIWISVNNLHEQSLNSLSRYFEDEQLLECITNNDLNDNTIEQNQIMFINWESINKENSLFRVENEQNWNLQSVVENTKDIGNTIVLLIDESHRNASTDKSKELIDIISPKLIIEVTATPKNTLGALIDIPLGEVIAEGMIKKEVRIKDAKERLQSVNTQISDLVQQVKGGVKSIELPDTTTYRIAINNHYLYYTWLNGKFLLAKTEAIPEWDRHELFNMQERNQKAFQDVFGIDLQPEVAEGQEPEQESIYREADELADNE